MNKQKRASLFFRNMTDKEKSFITLTAETDTE